jgi:hypothetical protein
VGKYHGKLAGILGTVIIHLLAGIIFMSFQLHELKTKKKIIQKFELEMVDEQDLKPKPEPAKLPPTSIENIFHDDVEMLNVARNLANKSDVKIDKDDYIDKVKEELIQSGKLGTDNYLDNPRSGAQPTEDDYLKSEDDKSEAAKLKEEEKQRESEKMAANYKGPTRIYYDLANRNHTYLPIPIYKCQGSGKIVLMISVDQKGTVTNASIVDAESTTSDECLIETAVREARISRFDADFSALKEQNGTLSYIFVAQ